MSIYLAMVKKLQYEFKEFFIEQLPRSENLDVDALANLGSSISSKYKRTIILEILACLSIMDVEDVCNAEVLEET